jgi:hypothetical protein
MGLYNIVHGTNPFAPMLLIALGFEKFTDVGRFRDAFVTNGEIAVYTRNGGGNRRCIHNAKDKDCGQPDCYACVINHRLPKHPLYLRDKDDNFDNTYATVYFKLPPQYAESLRTLDIGEFDPDNRWKQAINRVQRGELNEQEKKTMEELAKVLVK